MAFTSVMTRLSEMAKSKRYIKRIYYYGKSYFLPTDFNHIEVEITSFCNKCEYCPMLVLQVKFFWILPY